MKLLIVLCLLSVVALAYGNSGRGCIYINGRCARPCEEGTHAYTTGCSRKMPEATCDEPNPVLEEYDICDYSACYCDPPTVRDTASGKCVTMDKCPKKA